MDASHSACLCLSAYQKPLHFSAFLRALCLRVCGLVNVTYEGSNQISYDQPKLKEKDKGAIGAGNEPVSRHPSLSPVLLSAPCGTFQ